jgi:hypothetical protein
MRRLVAAALLLLAVNPAAAQQAEQQNMSLVGQDDLQARSAYQPVIQRQGARWIAYVGHHGGRRLNPLTGQVELNGTSIVDVTDPARPQYLHHIPGAAGEAEAGGAAMVRVCDGKALPKADPAKTYLLRTFGNLSHEVWDVSAPEQPKLLSTVVKGLGHTHKNWWECDTGIAYLVSDGRPSGWRTIRMTKIYDLSDPAQPRFIRDFGLPGQQPGATGAVPEGLHGAIELRDRVYIAYGTGSKGVLQIVDRDKLVKGDPRSADRFAPTVENLLYPQIGRLEMAPDWGGHTSFPVLGLAVPDWTGNTAGRVRDMVVLVSESLRNECQEVRQLTFLVDVTDPTKPFPVATFEVPESPGSFCSRGGRFGPHSSSESFTPIYYGRLVFIAYFNGGVRAVDIRDPFHPREAGFYIPAVTPKTDKRCVTVGGAPRCKVAIQTNNVEVDDRGYVYIVDRADTGMHILEPTGPARAIANFPAKAD